MQIGGIIVDDWKERNINGRIVLERKNTNFTKIAIIEPKNQMTCTPLFMGHLSYLNDLFDIYADNKRFSTLEEAKIYTDVFLEKASTYIVFT